MKLRVEHLEASVLVLLALLLLEGCAHQPRVLTELRIEKVEVPVLQPIPQHLLVDHPTVDFPTGDLTVQSLIRYTENLINIIEAYQLDKVALRELAGSLDQPTH